MSENLRKTQRRVLLAMLSSSAACLVLFKDSASQSKPARPTVLLNNRRNEPLVSQIKLPSQLLQKVTPAARRLTGNDLQLLTHYTFTPRTRNLTFREISSLIQALEEHYGTGRTLAGRDRTSAPTCCCCSNACFPPEDFVCEPQFQSS